VFDVYDTEDDVKNSRLYDNAIRCLSSPHNIKASFCQAPQTHPVQLKLAHENCTTFKRQNEAEAPYFLWGNKGPNVLPNTVPLPDGGYYLYTKVDGVTRRIRFTQCCNCCTLFRCPRAPFARQCSLKI
jgi:hypothetical protein